MMASKFWALCNKIGRSADKELVADVTFHGDEELVADVTFHGDEELVADVTFHWGRRTA